MRKDMLKGFLSLLCMLTLILDGKTALSGAAEGIGLCLQTIIPSLFPFFVLSSLMTNAFFRCSSLLRPLGKLCKIPNGAEPLLISGFLGGYPVGAQNVAQFYRDKLLCKTDAQRLLAFCNNAGPAFIFGILGPQFSEAWMVWMLWGIHVAGALLASRFFPVEENSIQPTIVSPVPLTAALYSALRTTGIVCGWVILFRVLIAFLKRWFLWYLPDAAQIALIGILELANGCCELTHVDSQSVRFVLCSGLLSLGGCCVAMQTMAVTDGLSLRCYTMGKLLQTLFSLLFSVLFVTGHGYLLPLLTGGIVFLSGKAEKRVAITRRLVYNKVRFSLEEPPCCFVKK